MGSTGIKAHKPTPDPSRREGRSLPPTPSEGGGGGSLSPQPLSQGEGSKMQIDLANTLVHKVYFVYHAFFIIACKLGLPLLRRGLGGRLFFNGEGTQTSELIIR